MSSHLQGWRVGGGLLGLLLLLGGGGGVRADPLPLAPADQVRVGKAVLRGVAYLKNTQGPDGTWATAANASHPYGFAALPGLALLECGVPASHSTVQRAVSYLHQNLDKITNTYEVALTILFLDRLSTLNDRLLGRAEDAELIRRMVEVLALRLIVAQTVSGGWTYGPPQGTPTLTPQKHLQLLEALAAEPKKLKPLAKKHPWLANVPALNDPVYLMGKDVKFDEVGTVKPKEKDKDKSGKPGPDTPGSVVEVPGLKEVSDNSCTQFATLAVWVAQRHQVPVDKSIKLVVKRFRSSQNADGGWGYTYKKGGGVAEGAPMICSGLLGLAVERGLDDPVAAARAATAKKAAGQLAATVGAPTLLAHYLAARDVHKAAAADAAYRKHSDEAHVRKGIEALAKHVGAPAGRFNDLPVGNLYFLYALERVAMLFNLQTIGGKDWYRWGAEVLVANQKPEGQWEGSGYAGSSAPIDTSFALLFLRQANLAEDLTEKIKMDLNAQNKPPAPAPEAPKPAPASSPPETKVAEPATAAAAGAKPEDRQPAQESKPTPPSERVPAAAPASTAPAETGPSRVLLLCGAAVAVVLIGVAVTLLIFGLQEKKGKGAEPKPPRAPRRTASQERANGNERRKAKTKIRRQTRSTDPED